MGVRLFTSIESEVDAERFSMKDGVLTDSFAGVQWQDNEDVEIKKDWQGVKNYCKSLKLNNKNDWDLAENKSIK